MTDDSPTTPRGNGLLFLCVGNSARSQMAEGFARFIGPPEFEYFSAGSAPTTLNAFAVQCMREVGIDISHHVSKHMDDIPMERIATIITLCAEESCPVLPATVEHLAWPLPDPAAMMGSDDDILDEFRRVREQIRELVSRLF